MTIEEKLRTKEGYDDGKWLVENGRLLAVKKNGMYEDATQIQIIRFIIEKA